MTPHPLLVLQTRWFSRAAHTTSAQHSVAAAFNTTPSRSSDDTNDTAHSNSTSNNDNSPAVRRAPPRRIRHHAHGAPSSPAHNNKHKPHKAHSPQQQRQTLKARPRLRLANQFVAALVTKRTSPRDFLAACHGLAAKDAVEVLAGTDLQAWNIALQHRLVVGDVAGARALLALIGSVDVENTSAQLWTDLLFTLMRQHSALSDGNEVKELLDALAHKCGADFVAELIVSTVNGCANIKMFDQAQFLVLYHLELDAAHAMPPRIVGNLVSAMAAKHRDADVLAFASDLFRHARFDLATFQQQGFLALFRSAARLHEAPVRLVPTFLQWFHANAARLTSSSRSAQAFATQHFERAFGAAIQCCVETESPKLALRCYDALVQANDRTDAPARIPVDENIYVNVLKAAAAQSDAALFRDVYRTMVSDGVARGPGFGSAIRFASVTHDVAFLEEVLSDAFALEDALQGAWMLDVPQYNDALGCFAATKAYDLAKDLFARMIANPFIVPDHVTMLEIVENHRDAPFSDVFHLMELFLEWDLCPNLQVFTSLLATCARRRLIGDAMALLDAMKAQGVEPDVKTFTVIAFVYGTHADVGGIVRILKTMASKDVATDDVFFAYVLNALNGASGIDVCFALVREMRDANLRIPDGLYNALIDVGTRAGVVERTLHMAYNMECDGFTLSSARMLALIDRCGSTPELTELLRTFELLHQGAQTSGVARFDAEVYEALIDVLARFAKKDAIPKVRQLALASGHDLPQ